MSDFTFHNHGSVMLLYAETEAAEEWADEHIDDDRTTFGHGIVVEHSCANDLFAGILDAGFTLTETA